LGYGGSGGRCAEEDATGEVHKINVWYCNAGCADWEQL
jgi:hypothetical protein